LGSTVFPNPIFIFHTMVTFLLLLFKPFSGSILTCSVLCIFNRTCFLLTSIFCSSTEDTSRLHIVKNSSQYSFMIIQSEKFGHNGDQYSQVIFTANFSLFIFSRFFYVTLETMFKWNLYLVYCSSTNRKPNEGMRLVLTTFVGIVFGFLIGISYPSLTTKVQTWNIFFLDTPYAFEWT